MPSPFAFRPAALAALLAACGAAPQAPVPLMGTTRHIAALAGRWEGSYSSDATGRSGSISFVLGAGTDTAAGDVVMIPRYWGHALRPWEGNRATPGQPGGPVTHSQVLTIRFVRVGPGQVSGTLAPYSDPETGAELFTTFEGRLNADTIAGTYTTRAAGGGQPSQGRWSVIRRAPSQR